MRLTSIQRAHMIKSLTIIAEEVTKVLDVLLGEDDDAQAAGCAHPPEQIEEDVTMDDEDDDVYRCKVCGKTQTIPFH